ncbi:hypothetical protein [Kribbella sp. NPDC049227]|uniref:hypothetical protein n=1 Tax=Kribbella sp. NPDC049227 TaxID=3364113 RepID=UPI0037119397
MVSDARPVEVDAVINRFVEFTELHDDVRGLLLAGSWARGDLIRRQHWGQTATESCTTEPASSTN